VSLVPPLICIVISMNLYRNIIMPAADVIAANSAAQANNDANPTPSPPLHQSRAEGVASNDDKVDSSSYYSASGAAALIKNGSDAVWAATDRFAKLPFVQRRLLLVQNGVAAVQAAAHQAQAKVVSIRDASTARVAEVRDATSARVASIRDASQHLITTSLATSQAVIANGKDKIAHVRTDIVSIAEQSLASARIVLDQRVTPRATEAVHVTRERLSATVALVQVQLDQLRSSLATVAADPRVAPIVDRVTPVAVATRARVDAAVTAVTTTAKGWSTASADFLKAHPIRGMPSEAIARARIVRDNTQRRVHQLLVKASADPRYALLADRVRPLTVSLVDLFRHTKAAAAAAAASIHIRGGQTVIPVAATSTSSSAPVTEEKNTQVAESSSPVVESAVTPASSAPAPVATPEPVVEEETKAASSTPLTEEEPTPVTVATSAPVTTAEPAPVTPQRRGAAGAGTSTGRKPKTSAKKGRAQ
jgi:hypothetical protein